jgi:ASC-1-like (ASCH) protein
MTQVHKLKTIGTYFDAVKRGEKTFDVRKNDRGFQTGDILGLGDVEDVE